MSITSLVVHVKPDELADVRARILALDGVEIHAETEDGRFVVTVDNEDDRTTGDTMMNLQNVEGVLSASLVYSYFDQRPTAEQETVQ